MLLCDQLLQWDARELPAFGDCLLTFKRSLRLAHHFVVDPSLAIAADSLSRDEVTKAAPVCRVPFERTWVEVRFKDRPKVIARLDRPLEIGTETPGRVGLLIEPTGLPGIYALTLAWDTPSFAGPMPLNISIVGALADLSGGESPPEVMQTLQDGLYGVDANGSKERGPMPLPMTFMMGGAHFLPLAKALHENAPEKASMFVERAQADWAGEPWFWMAVLALLNSRNGASVTAGDDRTKLNRARAKGGKPALVDYHVLTVRLNKAERAAMRAGEVTHASMRAHVVRGHFKLRKTGLYWWRPFVRGDLSRGFADKGYALTT